MADSGDSDELMKDLFDPSNSESDEIEMMDGKVCYDLSESPKRQLVNGKQQSNKANSRERLESEFAAKGLLPYDVDSARDQSKKALIMSVEAKSGPYLNEQSEMTSSSAQYNAYKQRKVNLQSNSVSGPSLLQGLKVPTQEHSFSLLASDTASNSHRDIDQERVNNQNVNRPKAMNSIKHHILSQTGLVEQVCTGEQPEGARIDEMIEAMKKRDIKDMNKNCQEVDIQSMPSPQPKPVSSQVPDQQIDYEFDDEIVDFDQEVPHQECNNWIEQFDLIEKESSIPDVIINQFKERKFNEIMDSWSKIKNKPKCENSVGYTEYRHLKTTVYPFWQAMLHYSEWVDHNDEEKAKRRAQLKQRIMIALDWLQPSTTYKYSSRATLEKALTNTFPFIEKDLKEKESIKILEGEYNEMYIEIDHWHKSILVKIKSKPGIAM